LCRTWSALGVTLRRRAISMVARGSSSICSRPTRAAGRPCASARETSRPAPPRYSWPRPAHRPVRHPAAGALRRAVDIHSDRGRPGHELFRCSGYLC
jgi:hypothetical protein